jgi:hypothetical protein
MPYTCDNYGPDLKMMLGDFRLPGLEGVNIFLIGPQGTSMCSRGPPVRRIPYKSGQIFFGPFV